MPLFKNRRNENPKPPLSLVSANPLVSIIIPSYNQGRFIRQTIESCLEQDYRPIEILVIDGASTDNTLEVLKAYDGIPELKWISEPDSGPVEAVNKGLALARGEIGAIQSSDDYYLPGCFSSVIDQFCRTPRAGLVFGDAIRVDKNGLLISSPKQVSFSLARLLAREVTIYQSSAFFLMHAVLAAGGWNAALPYVPDTDLWIRLAFRAEVCQLREALSASRTHAEQRDASRGVIFENYKRMLQMSKDLQTASFRLRLAARAGSSMLLFRYGEPWTNGQLTRAAWCALLCRPSLLFSSTMQKHRLIPGYFFLVRFYNGLRRKRRILK